MEKAKIKRNVRWDQIGAISEVSYKKFLFDRFMDVVEKTSKFLYFKGEDSEVWGVSLENTISFSCVIRPSDLKKGTIISYLGIHKIPLKQVIIGELDSLIPLVRDHKIEDIYVSSEIPISDYLSIFSCLSKCLPLIPRKSDIKVFFSKSFFEDKCPVSLSSLPNYLIVNNPEKEEDILRVYGDPRISFEFLPY